MKRLIAYSIIALSYIVAGVVCVLVFNKLHNGNQLGEICFALLVADIAATVVVWLFGLVFKNSSFYDPYWSVMPILLILVPMFKLGLWGAGNIVFLVALSLWSVRLTLNWAYTCKDITTEDWRYKNYRANNKLFMWHLINFFGINLVPTLVVFAALTPAVALVLANADVSFLMLLGAGIIILGTLIELVADTQMHRHRKTNANAVNQSGLWKFSRHPNYFGEIIVWAGVLVCMLAAVPQNWFLAGGLVLMILLFNCISIPLMEKRQIARRTDYAKYCQITSKLLFLPIRQIDEMETAQEDSF